MIEDNIEMYINNIKKMFVLRKYTDIESYTDDEYYRRFIITAKNKLGKKVMARIILGAKLHIGAVKECIAVFTKGDVFKGIIIHEGVPTSSGKNLILNVDKTDQIKINMFKLDYFSYHLLDHKYYFPHTKLKKTEIVEFKNIYDLKKIKIPTIFASDPVCKFFDFKTGDILKIKRKDIISYRMVKNT